jgi:superfamily I DNA/RNA helicase
MTEIKPQRTPTGEQQAILAAARTAKRLAVSAAAGTGKTTLMEMLANDQPNKRILYVVYNKSAQIEGEARMPSNVTCRTTHALAWPKYGKQMMDRINGPYRSARDDAIALGLKRTIVFPGDVRFAPPAQASMARDMVIRFCYSKAPQLTEAHFQCPEGFDERLGASLASAILPIAHRTWADMISLRGHIKQVHDVYLKQWAIDNPHLRFDIVAVDEAQDTNECPADVIDRQRARIIAVGDSAQSIYGWRGATDYLDRMNADVRLALTQSWRFGQAVADEANVWLGVVGTDMRVIGSPHLNSTLGPIAAPDAILCRTNAGTIKQLIEAHTQDTKVHLVGDGTEMKMLAEAAIQLQAGERAYHPQLVAFKTWEQVVEFAENDSGGSDLAVSVRMIEEHGAETVVDAIKKAIPAKRKHEAQLVVTTAHKAKGLEWPKVRIADDFKEPLEKETGKPLPIPKEDAMLAYVAVTRAMKTLDNSGLAWVHDHLAELGQ